jgi:hypothetical protein
MQCTLWCSLILLPLNLGYYSGGVGTTREMQRYRGIRKWCRGFRVSWWSSLWFYRLRRCRQPRWDVGDDGDAMATKSRVSAQILTISDGLGQGRAWICLWAGLWHPSKSRTKARKVGHIIAESSSDERKKTFFFFMCYSHEGVFVQVFGGLGQRGRWCWAAPWVDSGLWWHVR